MTGFDSSFLLMRGRVYCKQLLSCIFNSLNLNPFPFPCASSLNKLLGASPFSLVNPQFVISIMNDASNSLISTAVAPFCAIKESGLGREGTKQGLDEYFAVK
ncbi:hypothetical protein CCZ37_05130 [Vibrio qinghaiensis]|uniref:Aldehyde dehydrogenase domain-containing protein n=1 Tax=Vibrio qinghaiensis TaxID=2025808 RepID=A0A223MWP6_9VIBR|nr:hypothetical protein CCZ37_05130 [Vibrio qinghaiensis]